MTRTAERQRQTKEVTPTHPNLGLAGHDFIAASLPKKVRASFAGDNNQD